MTCFNISSTRSLLRHTLGRGRMLAALGTIALLLCLTTAAQAVVTAPSFGDLLFGLDGDDLTTSGANVTTWNDQVANGGSQNFIQDFNTGSTALPTFLPGTTMPNGTSRTVVNFAGGVESGQTLRLLADSNLDNLDGQSWYMVVRFDDPATRNSGSQAAYGINTSQNNTIMTTGITSGNVGQIIRKADGSQDVNAGDPPVSAVADDWYLLSGRFNMTFAPINGLTAGGHSFRAHDSTGTLVTSNTRIAQPAATGAGTHDQSILGNRGDGHKLRFMNGAIAEFLFYDDVLDSSEETQVWDYLLGKYFLAPSALDGDFNQDGVVDAADYTLWRDNEGSGTALPNDNGLGTPIGAAHYNLWVSEFGNTSLAVAVPEPGSMVLLGLVVAMTSTIATRRERV